MINPIGRLLTSAFFQRPIFVVGGSRSGTSILLQALGQHPRIYALKGESPFLTSIGGAEHLFTADQSSQYYQRSLKVPMSYLEHRLRVLGFEVAAGPHYGLMSTIRNLLNGDMRLFSARHWCAKTFPTEDVAHALVALYPQAKFVYIVRNGIDVVHSRSKFSGFRDYDFTEQCRVWAATIEKYRYFKTFDKGVFTRHEELLNDSSRYFADVLDFLDLSPNVKPSEFTQRTLVHPLDKSTRATTSAASELRSRPPCWENWTVEQKSAFREICSQGMLELGYEIPF